MFLLALKNNLYGLDINYLKIWLKLINCFKYNIFCFKILEVCFTSIGMWNSRHWYSKFKKTLFLKVKKSLLESEKGFEELKDNEPKDRKGRINGDIEELFF